MNTMKKWIASAASATLLFSTACAESVTLNATVAATETAVVMAAADGTVTASYANVGDHVAAGTQLVSLSTTSVCAEQAGTVTLFGAEGDSVEALITKYGSVASIEPDVKYNVSTASTSTAYDSVETQLVHNGETVYVSSTTDSTHTGTGMVYNVSGTSFSVEILTGDFDVGEKVVLYRGTSYITTLRVGKGTTSRVNPIAYTGSETGTIAAIHVENGQHVEKGDVLYELLSVTPSSMTGYDPQMRTAADGTLAEMSVSVGDSVTQGSVIGKLYTDAGIRLEVEVPESDLTNIAVGQAVQVEFTDGRQATGTVERISAVAMEAESTDDAVTYAAYVILTEDVTVRFGMTATVTTIEDGTAAAAAADAEVEEPAEAANVAADAPADMPADAPADMPEIPAAN